MPPTGTRVAPESLLGNLKSSASPRGTAGADRSLETRPGGTLQTRRYPPRRSSCRTQIRGQSRPTGGGAPSLRGSAAWALRDFQEAPRGPRLDHAAKAALGVSVSGKGGYQFLDSSTDTFEPPLATHDPSGKNSEDPLLDPIHHILGSAAENKNFESWACRTAPRPSSASRSCPLPSRASSTRPLRIAHGDPDRPCGGK